MTVGNTNEWKFDKTQSRSLWETNYVGITTESLIRTLSDFKSEKLIEIKEGKILIANLDKLKYILY